MFDELITTNYAKTENNKGYDILVKDNKCQIILNIKNKDLLRNIDLDSQIIIRDAIIKNDNLFIGNYILSNDCIGKEYKCGKYSYIALNYNKRYICSTLYR